MASGLKLAAQAAGNAAYFKVVKAELLDFAGPMLNRRFVRAGVTSYADHIYVDIAYPFRTAGFCTGWAFYHPDSGDVDMGNGLPGDPGDIFGLIFRNDGSGNLVVITEGVLPMKKKMAGEGIWFHEVDHGADGSGHVAVLAGDMIGWYTRSAPTGAGVIPRFRFDFVDETAGGYRIEPTVVPVVGSSYAISQSSSNNQALLDPSRLPIQAYGAGTDAGNALDYSVPLQFDTPITDEAEDPYLRGDGPILAPTVIGPEGSGWPAAGAAPEVYLLNTVGTEPSNGEILDLFDLAGSTTSGMSVSTGASGSIVMRLVNGAATVPVLHHIIGNQNHSKFFTGIGIGIYFSADVSLDNTPDNIADWHAIYQSPNDDTDYDADAARNQSDVHHHVHQYKRAKWVRFDYSNASGATRQFLTWLVYTATTQLGATDEYTPNFEDNNPEYFWATAEGATFLLTNSPAGTSVLEFSQADAADFAGLADGQTVWLRDEGVFTKLTIDTGGVDKTGPPPSLTVTDAVTATAGAFVDTRHLVLRVDSFNVDDEQIGSSPPLLIAGMFQDRFFKSHEESDTTGMP